METENLGGVFEEARDVGAGEGNAAHAEAEEHGDHGGQMVPIGHVVAGPDGAVALGAHEEGAGEHEGALVRRAALLPLDTRVVVVIAVSMCQKSRRLDMLCHSRCSCPARLTQSRGIVTSGLSNTEGYR